MSYEGNRDDSNVLDTLDFEAILRDNAGLARLVEHHTNMKVSEAVEDALLTAEDALETAKDDLKAEIIADLAYDDLPSRLVEGIEDGIREDMEDYYVSRETHNKEIENERKEAYDSGYEAGENNANENHEVTLRPSERGTRIMSSNGYVIDAEAVRLAYMDLQRGVLTVGRNIGGYQLRAVDSETIRLGCAEVSRAEVEYLALAMGWKAHEDGKVVREVSPIISERPDYQSGYEAGVQSMRDRLAGVLDATVTRSEGAV